MYSKNPDEMTPVERSKALREGKDVDRIPIVPFMEDVNAQHFGYAVRDYSLSAKTIAEIEIRAYRTFYHDGISAGPRLFGIAEAMGTVLGFPENEMPYVKEPILKDYKDFNKLKLINPYKDGRLPIVIEALKIMIDELGDEVGVGTGLGGPFTAAASIRGTDVFLRDLRKHPEEVHKLLELVTENTLRYIDVAASLGAKPSIAEPIGSSSIISPKQFRTFVQPYLKKYVDRIKEKFGSAPTLHMCGNTEPILEDMVDTGVSTISLDNAVDMELAKDRIGDKVTIMGNIKPIEIIKLGSKEEIYEDVRQCIIKCYDSPKGYVLATGCQIPLNTSIENIFHFMDAGRKYGKYPINPIV